MKSIPFLIIFLLFGCANAQNEESPEVEIVEEINDSTFVIPEEYKATQFNFPVGKPDTIGYFNAQKFGKNNHLGDDWNGDGGGNTDLGDPIYAIASGYVIYAQEHIPSWGNVIRIVHFLPNGDKVESLYAHCQEISVKPKQWVNIGDKIGTIGNADGRYKAHLHLEIREEIGLPIGPGYAQEKDGYVDPTEFIETHRKVE